MPAWEITTLEYDVPLTRLLTRRLQEEHADFALDALPDGAAVRVKGLRAVPLTAAALSRVLLRDLQYLVLARMTDAMPLSLADKRTVLGEALCAARRREEPEQVKADLEAYLRESDALCLDGFLFFRMQEVLMLWELCVEQAASKALLQKEYGELMQSLHRYVQSRRAKIPELRLLLREDGSCTLSDDGQLRIEYADASPDGLVSLLVQMAPEKLVVIDRSRGAQARLCDALREVFCGRMEIRI